MGLSWLFPAYNNRMSLSLAGVLQSASLVNSLAEQGQCDLTAFNRCLGALLNTSPVSDWDLFGSPEQMSIGLKELNHLCRSQAKNYYINRYGLQLIQLQKLLQKKASIQEQIQTGLEHAKKQLDMYGPEDENLIRNIAQLYQQTLSTLGFRIHVQGKHQYLQQELIAARVRVLLFSGVRFAHLWRQSGGHTHHLLTSKRTIGSQVAELLNQTTV